MTETTLVEQIDCPDVPSQLFEALNQTGVRYCNWKSSIRIPEGLQGRTDLDLLVDPRDTIAFREILQKYNLKLTRPAPGKEYPGIENYLGFDPFSGRLFHLHVHYQLVLGEQFVKNYHLPIEAAFLDETILRHGLKAPRPEVEIIVLCLRALLKYRDRDVIKDIFPILRKPGKKGGLPKDVTAEIRWLLGQTSLEQVENQLNRWQGILTYEAVMGLLSLVTEDKPAGRRLWHYRGLVRKALQDYQRRDRLTASLRYFREEWRRKRRIFKPSHEKKMTFAGGGPRIALVGVDGSGKSTATVQVAKWLAWRVSVGIFYMGKTRATLPALAIQPLIKLARMGYSFSTRRFGIQSLPAQLASEPKVILENLAALLQGQARLLAYRESCRRAGEGAVVLYDRYPLNTVWLDKFPVDGPRIAAHPSRLKKLQARLERSEADLYRQIRPPDHVIILRVSPVVLQRRRPDENGDNLAAKARAIEGIAPDGFGLTVIEAEQPLEDVLAQVKQVVWNLL
jgi:thymidylate kinase